jgi:hypothetical protein
MMCMEDGKGGLAGGRTQARWRRWPVGRTLHEEGRRETGGGVRSRGLVRASWHGPDQMNSDILQLF